MTCNKRQAQKSRPHHPLGVSCKLCLVSPSCSHSMNLFPKNKQYFPTHPQHTAWAWKGDNKSSLKIKNILPRLLHAYFKSFLETFTKWYKFINASKRGGILKPEKERTRKTSCLMKVTPQQKEDSISTAPTARRYSHLSEARKMSQDCNVQDVRWCWYLHTCT